MSDEVRDKLLAEVQAVDATALLPHHRRSALFILAPEVDLVDTAAAMASDDASVLAKLIEDGAITRPSLGQLADWCVDSEQRFQFVIVQPYVLAQPLPPPKPPKTAN